MSDTIVIDGTTYSGAALRHLLADHAARTVAAEQERDRALAELERKRGRVRSLRAVLDTVASCPGNCETCRAMALDAVINTPKETP